MNFCPDCSLPDVYCECQKEEEIPKIEISEKKIKYNRYVTIIRGIKEPDKKLSELKKKLGCGGTLRNNYIELQGKQSVRVKELLEDE